MLAVVDGASTLYKVFIVAHLLAAFVAFAPAFSWAFASMRLRKGGDGLPIGLKAQKPALTMTIFGPALLAAGIFGILALVVGPETSEGVKINEFSEPWVSMAFVVWFLMLGVVFGLILPAERQAAEIPGVSPADKRLSMANGLLHLLLVVMLVVMIFQPG